MRLVVTVLGEDEVAYELLRFAGRMEDISPALRAIAGEVREDASERFGAEGPGWAPLAESTIARKGNDRILFETGSLLASLAELGGEHVEVITDSSLVMSSSLTTDGGRNLAELHQEGTSRMPARKVVDVTEAQRRAHIRIIQRYIVDGTALTLHEAAA